MNEVTELERLYEERVLNAMDRIQNIVNIAVVGEDRPTAFIKGQAMIATALDMWAIKYGMDPGQEREKLVRIGRESDGEVLSRSGTRCCGIALP